MDDAKWERAAGAGGILFVVMVVVSAILPGEPPMTSDSADEIAKWFAGNRDQIREAALLSILASIPIVWWTSAVFRRLERATGNHRLGIITAIGIAVAVAGACVSAVVYSTIAMVGPSLAGGLTATRFFYILGTGMNGLVSVGTALAVGAVAAGILRTGMMPRWLGWFGALVALLAVLGTGVSVSAKDVVFVLSLVSFVAVGLWLLAVSVVMLRSPADGVPEPAPAVTGA